MTEEYLEIDLLEIIQALWKKAWALVLAFAVGVLIAFGITKFAITPLYKASAMMYVNNNRISVGSTAVNLSDLNAAQKLVDTYVVILKSRTTLEAVIEETGVPYTYGQLSNMVSSAAVNSTEIFSVTVTDSNAEEACLIANSIVNILPNRINSIVEGSSVSTVDTAVVPTAASSPSYTKNMALGGLFGLLLCGAFVVFLTLRDDTIYGEEQLTKDGSAPILTTIPEMSEKTSAKSYGYYGGYYGKPSTTNTDTKNNGKAG